MARYRGKRVLPPPPWKRPLLLSLTVAFLIFGGLLSQNIYRTYREQTAYRELARRVHDAEQARPSHTAQAVPEGAREEGSTAILLECGQSPQPQPSQGPSPYEALAAENPDFAGWLSIPDTSIDYPVMYTPQEPEYYLRRAFDGSDAIGGSLFIGEGCTPGGTHVIIYGHNMNDGSMFGSLAQYAEKDYAAAHPVIRFDTLEEAGEYRVLAAFYSHAYTSGEEGFRYYQYTDLSQPEVFTEYIQKAKEASLYDMEVEAAQGSRLLTLSTCSYHRENGTFLVVAVKEQ